MTIDATLCDFASVRENLLHLIGGGINRLWRESFPASMDLHLALLFEVFPSELDSHHSIEVEVIDADGGSLQSISGNFEVQSRDGRPLEKKTIVVPVVIDLYEVELPRKGAYSVELTVDNIHRRSLSVAADSNSFEGDRRRERRNQGG